MKLKTLSILLALTIISFSILPIISAYNGWGGSWGWNYYSSPLEFLENPWIMFALIFIILFGVIFYVLSKTFNNNAVAVSIAIALSLFISMAIAQRGLLYDYGYGELSSWALVIASLIAIAFLVRFTNENFGAPGSAGVLIIAWLIFHNIDPYQVLPDSLANTGFYNVYDFIFGISDLGTGILSLIVITLLVIWTQKGTRPRTIWDNLKDFVMER